MKAPSDSDDEDEEGANEDFDLDYAEFFSVLMYYGNMSKYDILHSSRRFLYGIFKQYAKRACENLGVNPDKKDEEENTQNNTGYPSQFKKFTKKEREQKLKEIGSEENFMKMFSGMPGANI